MAEPIRPEEIAKAKVEIIPDFVIESVNYLLALRYTDSSGVITIKQKDIVEEILSRAPGDTDRRDILQRSWLDFEEIYRSYGWEVEYTKPFYYKDFDAYYTFKGGKK